MSSGFITEAEIEAARKVRQAEWERVKKPEDPEEAPEPVIDHRSLYERLKEQKDKKDLEYEETHKLKNMIRGLDDDEVEFLDQVDKARMKIEQKQKLEEIQELEEFREKSATLHSSIDLKERLSAELKAVPKNKLPSTKPTSQKAILSGLVRKQPASNSSGQESAPKKAKADLQVTAVLPRASTGECSTLKCVAILPGIGNYKDTSDSDDSSDAEDPAPPGSKDLCGRRIVKTSDISES